jgi:hypothetical protein
LKFSFSSLVHPFLIEASFLLSLTLFPFTSATSSEEEEEEEEIMAPFLLEVPGVAGFRHF